jgi:hypothetical protein
MSENKPEDKKGLQLNWYWGIIGLLGFLGLILDKPVYYVFFVFFLFLLTPLVKNKKISSNYHLGAFPSSPSSLRAIPRALALAKRKAWQSQSLDLPAPDGHIG